MLQLPYHSYKVLQRIALQNSGIKRNKVRETSIPFTPWPAFPCIFASTSSQLAMATLFELALSLSLPGVQENDAGGLEA